MSEMAVGRFRTDIPKCADCTFYREKGWWERFLIFFMAPAECKYAWDPRIMEWGGWLPVCPEDPSCDKFKRETMTGYVGEVIRKRSKDTRITAVGPEDGKWRGVINLHDERGRFASRIYLSEEEYESQEQAMNAMRNLRWRAGR